VSNDVEIVSTPDFSYLARKYLGGNNDNIVTLMNDTLPDSIVSGNNFLYKILVFIFKQRF